MVGFALSDHRNGDAVHDARLQWDHGHGQDGQRRVGLGSVLTGLQRRHHQRQRRDGPLYRDERDRQGDTRDDRQRRDHVRLRGRVQEDERHRGGGCQSVQSGDRGRQCR